jgi:hypothetical protein
MTPVSIPIDVFLRGDREYVQGTQIVSRLADLLSGGEWSLDQAQFHRLTVRRLSACNPSDADVSAPLARVQFIQPSGTIKAFVLIEGASDAPRRNEPMPIAVSRLDGPPRGNETGMAIWNFRNVEKFEDLLNVIVQAVKGEHSFRWPGCHDVWLTGFRRLALPVSGAFPLAGRVELSFYRKLATADQVQTVWQIALPESDVTGVVTFAFRTQETGDAD